LKKRVTGADFDPHVIVYTAISHFVDREDEEPRIGRLLRLVVDLREKSFRELVIGSLRTRWTSDLDHPRTGRRR
jgi:hypothetical protein